MSGDILRAMTGVKRAEES